MDKQVVEVLAAYEARIAAERSGIGQTDPDGRDMRMRAIGPDAGRFLNILVRSLEAPVVLEIGTSFGHSTIWLAEAVQAANGRLITMEQLDYKSAYARDMAVKAGLGDAVDFQVGDALDLIAKLPFKLDFVFLDLWKDLYVPCLDLFYEKLNPGALIVADNMIRPGGENIRAYARALREKPGIETVLLPVGTGLEVSRFAV